MTEYTTSSQAYREYMSARERTAYWIQGVSGSSYETELLSPSVPPSVLDGLIPSSPPSEADSSHSTPPKMILRYGDGRPDVPIPHSGGMDGRPGSKRHHHHQDPNQARSQTLSYNQQPSRSRSGSSADTPSYGSHSRRYDNPRAAPEEIRILPTYGEVPASSNSSRPSHSRSKSLPRTAAHHTQEPPPELPFMPPPHMKSQSPFYAAHTGSANHQQVTSAPPQQVNFAPQPQWPSRQPHAKHPPAIVYAPSHHTQRPNYAPPVMLHHPPQMGPNGMIYSHSAPVPGQYPPAYPTPYPSVGSHRHTASAQDVRSNNTNRRDPMRSLGRSTRLSPTESSESLASGKSGSTYYVLPGHGQKVHVITPSPRESISTAPSSKSPTTPQFEGRKPFFQRFFNFKKFSHAGSSHGSEGRKLHRRHSLGGGHHGSRGSSEDS